MRFAAITRPRQGKADPMKSSWTSVALIGLLTACGGGGGAPQPGPPPGVQRTAGLHLGRNRQCGRDSTGTIYQAAAADPDGIR